MSSFFFPPSPSRRHRRHVEADNLRVGNSCFAPCNQIDLGPSQELLRGRTAPLPRVSFGWLAPSFLSSFPLSISPSSPTEVKRTLNPRLMKIATPFSSFFPRPNPTIPRTTLFAFDKISLRERELLVSLFIPITVCSRTLSSPSFSVPLSIWRRGSVCGAAEQRRRALFLPFHSLSLSLSPHTPVLSILSFSSSSVSREEDH